MPICSTPKYEKIAKNHQILSILQFERQRQNKRKEITYMKEIICGKENVGEKLVSWKSNENLLSNNMIKKQKGI